MKIKAAIIILFLTTAHIFVLSAHEMNYDHVLLRNWVNKSGTEIVQGSYMLSKNGNVYVEDAAGKVVILPMQNLAVEDQQFVIGMQQKIGDLNDGKAIISADNPSMVPQSKNNLYVQVFVFVLMIVFGGWALFRAAGEKRRLLLPVMGFGAVCILGSAGTHLMRQLQSNTSIPYLDSSFTPFIPQVHTFSNSTYYYVESKGIPVTHTMMVGISNHGWQQQVPIPQCYLGANAWPIPLNPVVAATPIPVDSIHFTRGAVAIAVNGVPIFNVHTNTGVDSYLDGQLDNYGGHCGRADDYHYHTAPLHLYNYTLPTLPIAWALDGFAVYGALEPDGAAMLPLDANHGHFGSNGVYHYHGTAAAPYMIANMVGQVTEDATHQLIPQAAANPIRPALTPLNGALITGCTPNAAGNGYNLTYTLSGVTDSVVYYWDNAGHYTYNFYTASGLTTSNYTDFIQCVVPTLVPETLSESGFSTFYNQTAHCIEITIKDPAMQSTITDMELIDMNGKVVNHTSHFVSRMNLENSNSGVYMLRVQSGKQRFAQKLIIY